MNSSNRQIGQYGVQSDDSSLYYMRARYYNAAIKRFINQDTVTESIESSQSLNRYAYVEGNPISYLDPFGLCPIKDIYDLIHRITDGIDLVCAITEGTLIICCAFPALREFSIPLFLKVTEFQLCIDLADLSISTLEIIDNWNNYTIDEKEQGIAEIVVMLYENLAFKCIEKYDQSFEMQLKIYMTSLIQEALDKVINK